MVEEMSKCYTDITTYEVGSLLDRNGNIIVNAKDATIMMGITIEGKGIGICHPFPIRLRNKLCLKKGNKFSVSITYTKE